jgi:Phospholipase B
MRQLALSLLIAATLPAATPLFESSFDTASTNWTALRGKATTDAGVTYQGRKSLRVEPVGGQDASVRSAPISLAIGKSYELSGWIRTEALTVRDLDRTPIATGAALTMASMPFDMHSESVGSTHDWTRVHLRFTATRAQDNILLIAGAGGAFDGKVWYAGVSIDETSQNSHEAWPAPAAVTTYGPAYRYPTGGWIHLHIEGQPYERGYQHGRLMSKEIVDYMARCAADLDSNGKNKSWNLARTTAAALFMHGFDQEILEEMKGIADGASDAGARWDGRRINLTDMLVVNTTVELSELSDAMHVTPSGLEGLHLVAPAESASKIPAADHCSSFAATGKATRDGRMVIGHVTWWPLTLAEQTNVMLDLKPATGHRVLMQSYPGGIESGTDWYQNDAGVVLTETTIRQSPFNPEGTPVAYRARKAIQYGDSIDKVVEYLGTKNNGLYTNEWLMGDARTNEIAMYELGTYKTRLWRSTKDDWFAGTDGFYWGDNNAKDLAVRLEEQRDPNSDPEYVPYSPGPRDLKWQELYREYSGKIDEQFAFLAFRTAPLVSATTMDAKVVTADMASRMMLWAEFGKPNQREWVPSRSEKAEYAKNDGLYPSGYRLIAARASAPESKAEPEPTHPQERQAVESSRLWKGWVLPASDADTWFSAGSAAYFEALESSHPDRALAAHWAEFRSLSAAPANPMQSFQLETQKGVLFLDQLRRDLGDESFFKLMKDYFAAHTTQTVTAQSFLDAAGMPFKMPADPGGPMYLASDIRRHLATAILVYGTVTDVGANRYAAEQLQAKYLNEYESQVPIRKDFEVTAEELRTHDIIFVGRPETNSALAEWREKIALDSSGAMFKIHGSTHASETESFAYAAANPLDRTHMVLVLAGNNALSTVQLVHAQLPRAEYEVFK